MSTQTSASLNDRVLALLKLTLGRLLGIYTSNREAFKLLAALALLFALSPANRALNRRALNNHILAHGWDWPREIAIVTGGASGIGRMTAEKLARAGLRVAVLDLQAPTPPFPPSLWPSRIRVYEADVTNSASLRRAAERVRAELGCPTVLVNNAGIGTITAVLDQPEAQLRRTLDVNLLAPFLAVREFVPHMARRNHGHVVTVASMASFLTLADNVDYSASKLALVALHEGLAQELKHRYGAPAVRTSIIHPTWVRTPMTEPMLALGRFNDRVMSIETVADAIAKQVLGGESGQVFLPRWYVFVGTIRAWPHWLQELLRDSRGKLLLHASEARKALEKLEEQKQQGESPVAD